MPYEPSHSQRESQQIWNRAIAKVIEQISQQENIQTVDHAIDSLKLTGGQYASPSVHALYLQKVPESKGFTRKDISIYLADLGEDHETLRTYFQLVHFGGLSIDESLRLFYTQLRLEPLMNTNMLDVLLTGLATAFKANGGRFEGDIEDCIRVYQSMIMLNRSLHNTIALGRSRQTEQGFLQIINDRNANNVKAFGEDEMRRIFRSIQNHSLSQIKRRNVMVSSQPATHTSVHNPTKPPVMDTTASPQNHNKSFSTHSEKDVASPTNNDNASDDDNNNDNDVALDNVGLHWKLKATWFKIGFVTFILTFIISAIIFKQKTIKKYLYCGLLLYFQKSCDARARVS